MLTDLWGFLLSLPADFWVSLRLLAAWYLPRRTKNLSGDEDFAPAEADPYYPPVAEIPMSRCPATAPYGDMMLLACCLHEYHFGGWHKDAVLSWRKGPRGLEVRKATGPAPIQADASR